MLDNIQNKHMLVDGDILAYRCAAVAEKTKYLVENTQEGVLPDDHFDYTENHKEAVKFAGDSGIIWSRKEVQPVEFALQACKTTLDALTGKLSPSKVSIYLSPDRTFRHDIAKTKPYKGNRTQPKPKYLQDVREYLVREHGGTIANNIEADDEIGKALSSDRDGGVSVSIDKDLLQIPGWHYNWVNNTVRRVTPQEGDFAFYTQLLTGDTTDNVPGLPGTGPVRAKKLLDGAKSSAELCTRAWMCYKGEFNDTQKARSYFLEQARLLWILRTRPAGPQYILHADLK